jgi:uncharacterized protein (DUF1330 family)
MAAAYMIIGIDIHDNVAFAPYGAGVAPILASYGAEVVVASDAFDVLEGTYTRKRSVILKFPSMEKARTFFGSDEYAPMIALRETCSDGDIILVEGLA